MPSGDRGRELGRRRADADEAVRTRGDRPVDELGARLGVGVVREPRARARATFDLHLEAVAELRHGLGDECHAALAVGRLLRNSDAHAVANFTTRPAESGPEPSQRLPDVELRPRAPDDLVRELRRARVTAQIRRSDAVGNCLEARLAHRPACGLRTLLLGV